MKEQSSQIADEKQATSDRNPAERSEGALGERVEEVFSITRKHFSEPIKVVEEEDPEIEGEWYYVFHVAVSGSPQKIIARQREWHRRIIDCAGDEARRYRIALHFTD